MPITTTDRSTLAKHRTPWLAALALSAALLTGCGANKGDGGVASLDDAPQSTATAEPDDDSTEDAMTAFRRCMQEQGVPIDDAGTTGRAQADGEDDPNLQAAAAQCEHLLEGSGITFGTGGTSDALSPDQLEGLVDYAGCMRENGVEVPDPDPSSGGLLAGPGGDAGPDTNSPAFTKAHEECQAHLPNADAEGAD